jgi:hypothetical protein
MEMFLSSMSLFFWFVNVTILSADHKYVLCACIYGICRRILCRNVAEKLPFQRFGEKECNLFVCVPLCEIAFFCFQKGKKHLFAKRGGLVKKMGKTNPK